MEPAAEIKTETPPVSDNLKQGFRLGFKIHFNNASVAFSARGLSAAEPHTAPVLGDYGRGVAALNSSPHQARRMRDELEHHIHVLKAEIITDERSADDIVGLARTLKQAGHESLAATLFAAGRQLRIKALDLRGKLAALTRFGRDE